MKCLNCDSKAVFRVKNDSSDDQFYCEADLPSFLNERVFWDRTERLADDAEPVAKAKKKKEEPTPAPEPTPEPVVAEKVEEAPAVE